VLQYILHTQNAITASPLTAFLSFIHHFNSGGLPPDSRKDQARLFSTPDSGYDVLVASDAIGMGLNLAIKRIIFSQVEKFDGRSNRELTPAVRTAKSSCSIINATSLYSIIDYRCTVSNI
jgi:superfamily II RNA helicase